MDPDVDLCGWANLNMSAFEWLASNGGDSYWIGGPRRDKNDNNAEGSAIRSAARSRLHACA